MAHWWLPASVALVLSASPFAPHASAEPLPPTMGSQPASAVVDDLEAQGYNVQINWTTGYDTKPLSQCWVTGVNNPGSMPPSEDTFTTVYVDVACPNGDDGGFSGGVGIGIG